MNEFTTIRLVGVDEFGLKFEVAGTWNNKPYRVEVWTECDGREVECEEMVDGEFNPGGFDVEDPGEFCDVLFREQRFIDLSNQGYKTWEAMPQQD